MKATKAAWSRAKVWAAVAAGGENGVSEWIISREAGVSGAFLSHALVGLMHRGAVQFAFREPTKTHPARFVWKNIASAQLAEELRSIEPFDEIEHP